MSFKWLNGMLTGIRVLFWGQVLEAFATGICVSTVQNMATAELDIDRILSVCTLFVQILAGRFLGALFMKLQLNSDQNRSKKRPKKSANRHADRQTDRQTNKQTDLADPELLRGHVFDSQNAYTSRRCLKNLSSKRPLNPANIPVKEHLRLASVVALSSNGACGAIN